MHNSVNERLKKKHFPREIDCTDCYTSDIKGNYNKKKLFLKIIY